MCAISLQEADDALAAGDLETRNSAWMPPRASSSRPRTDSDHRHDGSEPALRTDGGPIASHGRSPATDLDFLRQQLAIAQETNVDELEGQALAEWETLAKRDEEIVQRYNEDFVDLESTIEDIIDELFG